MAAEIASVVIFANAVDRTSAFYRALGVELEDEDHGDTVRHAAINIGDAHFAIFPAAGITRADPEWREAGSTFIGFYVPSLGIAVSALEGLGAKVLARHGVRDWGCRAVIEDPDGRAVEVNQRGHCPAP